MTKLTEQTPVAEKGSRPANPKPANAIYPLKEFLDQEDSVILKIAAESKKGDGEK